MTDIFARLAADMAVIFPTAAGSGASPSVGQASSLLLPTGAIAQPPTDPSGGAGSYSEDSQ